MLSVLSDWGITVTSLVTDEFPAQMASKAENVSIWWRHHGVIQFPIFFRVSLLTRGGSYDCPSTSEVTLKDMSNMNQYLAK